MAMSAGALMLDKNGLLGRHGAKPVDQPAKALAVSSKKGRITAITANANGQFHAAALVNGVHVDMLADTGATLVVLSNDDADRIGIDPGWLDFNVPIKTANGTSKAASIVLDEIVVGGIRVRDVEALVAKPGLLDTSLLGMSFIGAISRFELRGNQLVLVD